MSQQPTYRIWCRTAEVGPDQFIATVCAIPEGQDAAAALESETRIFTTLGRAREECAFMADRLRIRMSMRGQVVTGTDFV